MSNQKWKVQKIKEKNDLIEDCKYSHDNSLVYFLPPHQDAAQVALVLI